MLQPNKSFRSATIYCFLCLLTVHTFNTENQTTHVGGGQVLLRVGRAQQSSSTKSCTTHIEPAGDWDGSPMRGGWPRCSRPTTRSGDLLTFLRTKKKQLFQGGDAEAEPAAFTDAQPASSEPSEEEPEDALEDEMDLETLAGIRKAM